MRLLAAIALGFALVAPAAAQTVKQTVKLSPIEGDYIAKDFKFRSG